MNVWIRTLCPPFNASHARSTSPGFARARLQMTGPSTSFAMRRMASKSPGELKANPASITSTPSRANCRAIDTFSSTFMLAPGDCSPSRSVVSKMVIVLVIAVPSKRPAFPTAREEGRPCPHDAEPSDRPRGGVSSRPTSDS